MRAMAFYHQDGLPAAWKQAKRFAGQGGRLATLPDVVTAWLETKPGDPTWETYYTTLTAEYFGVSARGNRILIVAHGLPPMNSLEDIHRAYRWEYQDKTRRRRGGRITQKQFLDLESGKFGDVHVIDFDEYCRTRQYPFISILRSSEALEDPVFRARLGARAEEYVQMHALHARQWHHERINPVLDKVHILDLVGSPPDDNANLARGLQHAVRSLANSRPYIVGVQGAANCYYGHSGFRVEIEEGFAFAHLISVGRLCNLHHEGNESLVRDVSCHEWGDGTRLVGIQSGDSAKPGIQSGPNAYELLRQYWQELLVSMERSEEVGFRALVQIGDQWFTQYPKKGASMDTHEPEYVVTSLAEMGEPVLFRTTTVGYHMFFRFGTNEVQAIAPPGANAYRFVTEPENEYTDGNPTHQTAMVQFYKADVDTTKRLVRADTLCYNYEKLMSLLQRGEAV